MKPLFVSAVAVAMLAVAGLAHAEETEGTVSALDAESRVVELDNGETFRIAPDVDLSVFQVGSKLTITYEQEEDEKVISAVVPQE